MDVTCDAYMFVCVFVYWLHHNDIIVFTFAGWPHTVYHDLNVTVRAFVVVLY